MFKKRFQFLIGDPVDFPLHSRMFHALSLLISMTFISRAIFFYFTSLQFAFIACVIFALADLGLYYMSRFKQKVNEAINLSAFKLTATLIINYMFNAGIDGNMLLLAAATLFLVILITPIKHRLFWLFTNLGIVFMMMILEYMDPSMVKQHYLSRTEKFIDLGVAYLTVAGILSVGIYVLRKSCDQQKNLAKAQAAKLQVLNDEKDKLFSIISHDLNSPMASVKQYLELIQSVELDAEERAMVEQDLGRSLKNAQYLLNNLLNWSKNQMQQKQVVLEKLNLSVLLKETIGLFQLRAEKKGITIKVALQDELNVHADQNMLQLVVRNLLNNAIKFTNPNGAIEVLSRLEDGQCMIQVKDDGTGIAADKQASIFSLNVVSSYGTANEKGTGLGLMLCKDFIEQQGGKIWFESTPGKGTTFYVTLPAAAVALEYC